mgnify:CR=1 FL=1
MLTIGEHHLFHRQISDLCQRVGASVRRDYEGTSLDAVRQMAAMGGSVAVLPSLYMQSEAREDPGLVVRRLDAPEAVRDIDLLWRPTSPLFAKFQTIGHLLSSAAEELLKPDRVKVSVRRRLKCFGWRLKRVFQLLTKEDSRVTLHLASLLNFLTRVSLKIETLNGTVGLWK